MGRPDLSHAARIRATHVSKWCFRHHGKSENALIERARMFAVRLGHKIRRASGRQFSLKLDNGSQIFAVAHTTD